MRLAMLGVLAGVGLALAAVGATPDGRETLALRPGPHGAVRPSGELVALSVTVDNKFQQVTVIDPKLRAMSVYHIEMATGQIEFLSQRNIHYDLQMLSHNIKGVLPEEILSMLDSR